MPSGDDTAAEVDDKRTPVPCEHQGVAYVPLEAWQPSARVVRLEANMKTRDQSPPAGMMSFPKLTSHRAIGETTYYRFRGRRRR